MKTMNLLVILLVAAGCRTTYQIGEGAGTIGVHDALVRLQGEACTLTLQNGKQENGMLVGYQGDSLVFQRRDEFVQIPVSLNQVYSVAIRGSRIPGTITGTVVGGLIGALAGSATEDKNEGWPDVVNEHKVGIVVGTLAGASIGGIVGYYALPSTTVVRFAPPDSVDRISLWQEKARENSQVIGLVVPVLIEENDTSVMFSYGGRTVRLPRGQVTLEHRTDGVLVRATRSAFQAAGLTID